MPQPQNQRGAVLIVGGIAYVAYGGHYGDCGNYHGWVIGVPLRGTGRQGVGDQVGRRRHLGRRRAGERRPEHLRDDAATASAATTTWAESEGIFRLDPGPDVHAADAPTTSRPTTGTRLDNADLDLSGSGPLVIDAPAITPSKLVMAQGKDGYLYLIDRTNLGGIATLDQLANVGALQVQSGEISNARRLGHGRRHDVRGRAPQRQAQRRRLPGRHVRATWSP